MATKEEDKRKALEAKFATAIISSFHVV